MQVHIGVADSQCGIIVVDIYSQNPSNSFITSRGDGTKITQNNYDSTLFYTLGFSYYDLKPIRFSSNSFNNRFNPSIAFNKSGNIVPKKYSNQIYTRVIDVEYYLVTKCCKSCN